ncbi:MAG: DUF2911 domain-containing protein [Rhodothermales bacterium]|nr:DUF2911 domain-containing protein [Rhodothermales bacterium]
MTRLLTTLALAGLFAIPHETVAQDLHPSRRLSPIGIARTHIGDTYVKVTYGRPYIRGRQIFGTNNDSTSFLVPYGQIWRTGASESTEITITGPVMLAGNPLEAGTYSIYTEPGPEEWVIHISPQLGLDGTGIFNAETGEFTPNVYQPANDVMYFRTPVKKLPEDEPVDQFTISLEDSEGGSDLVLRWEWTEVRVPVRLP